MPEEHTGQLGFEYAWKELLARSRQSGTLQHTTCSLVIDGVCFSRGSHDMQLSII
jgi:hypothetical protein